jgi:hypothetical protein
MNLLLEIEKDGIRVSKMHPRKDPLAIDWIHDPVLAVWLEVLSAGPSFDDAVRAIREQVEFVIRGDA